METFNFSEFKAPEVVKSTVKKEGSGLKEQGFDGLKYRRGVSVKNDKTAVIGTFFLSTAKFKEGDLENHGVTYFVHPVDKNTVLLAVTKKDSDAKALKQRVTKAKEGEEAKPLKKGVSFKLDALEAALSAAGIISLADVDNDYNQFLTLTSVGADVTIDKVDVSIVWKISKEDRPFEKKQAPLVKGVKKASAKQEDTLATTPVVEAAKAEPAPAVVAAPATVATGATPEAAPAVNDWD